MDLTRLPANIRSAEERVQALDKVNRACKDCENASRAAFKTHFLALSPEQIRNQTFALAQIVHAVLTSSQSQTHNENDDLDWVRIFLERCDADEIRWADPAFEGICKILGGLVSSRGQFQASLTVGPLLIALGKRLSGRWNELCSIHADLLQVCLVSKMYHIGVQVAEVSATSLSLSRVEKTAPPSLPLDLQRYFYYAGIAFCAVRKFREAFNAFKQCLSLPAKGFGAVHLEAYKRYVLTSLIHKGNLVTLPRYTDNSVIKSVHTESRPTISAPHSSESKSGSHPSLKIYAMIAQAYEKQDMAAELQTLMANPEVLSELTSSGNCGMMSHVFDAYLKKRIVALTGTYVTLSLQEFAAATNTAPQNTEQQLIKMIRDKDIRAQIDQRNGTVRFLSYAEDADEQASAVSKLEGEIARLGAFAQELRSYDDKITTSKQYIKRFALRSDPRLAREVSGADAAMMFDH